MHPYVSSVTHVFRATVYKAREILLYCSFPNPHVLHRNGLLARVSLPRWDLPLASATRTCVRDPRGRVRPAPASHEPRRPYAAPALHCLTAGEYDWRSFSRTVPRSMERSASPPLRMRTLADGRARPSALDRSTDSPAIPRYLHFPHLSPSPWTNGTLSSSGKTASGRPPSFSRCVRPCGLALASSLTRPP
jgi:hypothetical protein